MQNDTELLPYKRYNGIDGIKSNTGYDGVYFMSAITDDDGNLWFATFDNGVWFYDGENIKQYKVKDGAEDVTLFSVYKDKNGSLWLGSHDAGAYKFNGKSFEKFAP